MTADAVERESMDFDVVIVGAGPAGLAAAIRIKQLAAETGQPPTIIDMMQYGAAMSGFQYYVGAADKFTWQDIRDGIDRKSVV